MNFYSSSQPSQEHLIRTNSNPASSFRLIKFYQPFTSITSDIPCTPPQKTPPPHNERPKKTLNSEASPSRLQKKKRKKKETSIVSMFFRSSDAIRISYIDPCPSTPEPINNKRFAGVGKCRMGNAVSREFWLAYVSGIGGKWGEAGLADVNK
jgi:hypothetical protein